MGKLKKLVFLVAGFLPLVAGAQLRYGQDIQSMVTLKDALAWAYGGMTIVIGEEHYTRVQAQQQLDIINQLLSQKRKVTVGFEFFPYTAQADLDSWRKGQMTTADFMQKIGWRGDPSWFGGYETLAKTPGLANVIALNMPRTLTDKVAQYGIDSLTSAEVALLPPNFVSGNAMYKERFMDTGGAGHKKKDPKAMERYFMAQSIWDDTMAWRASEYLQNRRDEILVIIVGAFHMVYGGGLPDRMIDRGMYPMTFTLVNTSGLTPKERSDALEPHPKYGRLSDYVWEAKF